MPIGLLNAGISAWADSRGLCDQCHDFRTEAQIRDVTEMLRPAVAVAAGDNVTLRVQDIGSIGLRFI